LLTPAGRWGAVVRVCRSPRARRTFVATSLLLAVNWLVYIHGVTTRQTVETSLGYFINPLLNVALGMIFFRERLRPLQAAALALATLGVLLRVAAVGQVPWIALTLAFSFGFYGLLRKTAPADAFVGLAVETFVLVPPALAYLLYL